MSAYKLEELIQLWAAEKVTVEQAIGQILMLLRERDEWLRDLEGRLTILARALEEVASRVR
jgi:hypothetical protein